MSIVSAQKLNGADNTRVPGDRSATAAMGVDGLYLQCTSGQWRPVGAEAVISTIESAWPGGTVAATGGYCDLPWTCWQVFMRGLLCVQEVYKEVWHELSGGSNSVLAYTNR